MPADPPRFSPEELAAAALLVRGEPVSVEDLADTAVRLLGDSSALDEGHDHAATAMLLLCEVMGRETPPEPVERVPPRQRERFLAWIARRAAGEPVARILGWTPFCGLRVGVAPGCFAPRPSSEFLVRTAAGRVGEGGVALDLCTGTGAVALAVAHRAGCEAWGVDISPVAIRCAAANARSLGLSVRFRTGDLYAPLPPRLRGRVGVITAYAPYLSLEDVAGLPGEVRDYEPIFTLITPEEDPLALLRRIVEEGAGWLRPGGSLLIQIDTETATALAAIMEEAGMGHVRILTDEASWDAIVEGRLPAG